MNLNRRTLDVIFSIGGLFVAVLVLVLGLVLQNQADFAQNYVRDQLSAQKITFTPADKLGAGEDAPCLAKYAGQLLATGTEAECYANHYIAVHLGETNDGKTYAETSNESRAAATAAKAAPDNAQLQNDAKTIATKTDTLFKGETLRGLLLTSYGFSIFGERAAQAALVCFLVAGVLFLASMAGFVHAFTNSKDKTVTIS